MEYLVLVSLVLHIILNGSGIIANSLLVFLVLRKTPKLLATYSMLILNLAICELLACVSDLFVQQRIIPCGPAIYYFSYGPCKYLGPLICYAGHSFTMHCYAHLLWSLLFSFSYRYYILGNASLKSRTVIGLLALLYIPSFTQFVTFCFSSDNAYDVKVAIAAAFKYDVTDECVSGVLSIVSWKALITVLNMTLPIVPVYTAILVLRRATASKLGNVKTMSEYSRKLQSQLLKALIYQACLPFFSLIAILVYVVGQLGICHHPILEFSPMIIAGFVPLLSPLTSFRFIGPYRVWIRDQLLTWFRSKFNQSESRVHPAEQIHIGPYKVR